MLLAADAEPPSGQFLFALSPIANDLKKDIPIVSLATIKALPDGTSVMRLRDEYHGAWDIPIKFRVTPNPVSNLPVQPKRFDEPIRIMAFDGNFEKADAKGGSGRHSMILTGTILPDGTLEGTLIDLITAGYRGSTREYTSVRHFKMRALEAEQADDATEATKPGDKVPTEVQPATPTSKDVPR